MISDKIELMDKEESAASREAYGQTLVELGAVYPELVVLDADLSVSTQTSQFAGKYPDRFFNVGVAEMNLMGTAAGLAAGGKIVFASSFAMFAFGRPWEVIRNSICYPRLNVKIVATHGGLTVGEDGSSHQFLEDLALARVIPTLTVIVPSDANQTREVIKTAARLHGPVYVRLCRPKTPLIYRSPAPFKLGQAILLREGKDVTIIAIGLMVKKALAAAEMLAKEKISARVLDMPTLKPIDEEAILDSARKTSALVTAEEHSIIGGLGGSVAEILSELCPTPLVRVGVRGLFGESGKSDELLVKYGLTADAIYRAALKAIQRKNKT